MSTTVTPTPVRSGGLPGAVRSEWIKLWSIRSTWWCLAALLALTAGFGTLLSSTLSFQGVSFVPSPEAAQAMAVSATMVSIDLTALIVSVVGVLAITSEYGTGTIQSTLTAIPKRTPALVAKAIVLAFATLVAGVVAFAVTIPLSVALFAGNDVEVDLGDGRYWLSYLGAVAYLVMIGLISLSLGALIRNTAGGIATSIALILAAPIAWRIVGGVTDATWTQNAEMLFPPNLGLALFSYPAEWAGDPAMQTPTAEGLWTLEPWQGGLGLVVWVVVLFGAAAVAVKRRDA